MALYRFLFAPALLALAVLAGPGPSRAPSADRGAPAHAQPAPEASPRAAPPQPGERAGSPRPVRAR